MSNATDACSNTVSLAGGRALVIPGAFRAWMHAVDAVAMIAAWCVPAAHLAGSDVAPFAILLSGAVLAAATNRAAVRSARERVTQSGFNGHAARCTFARSAGEASGAWSPGVNEASFPLFRVVARSSGERARTDSHA